MNIKLGASCGKSQGPFPGLVEHWVQTAEEKKKSKLSRIRAKEIMEGEGWERFLSWGINRVGESQRTLACFWTRRKQRKGLGKASLATSTQIIFWRPRKPRLHWSEHQKSTVGKSWECYYCKKSFNPTPVGIARHRSKAQACSSWVICSVWRPRSWLPSTS